MEQKICVFTGHRSINAKHMALLATRLDEVVERLIAEGYTEFRTGGAYGFDTVAALKVLEKKRKYGFVKLHLFLPCHGQERGWKQVSQVAYRQILAEADSAVYSCERYVTGCMLKRDREMVEGAQICVAYYNGVPKGGTAYTVKLAEDSGLEVINVFVK